MMKTQIFHQAKNLIFKNSSKRNQNPSRYYNFVTNFKFQHKPKCLLSKIHKNRPICEGLKSIMLLYSIMNLNAISLPWCRQGQQTTFLHRQIWVVESPLLIHHLAFPECLNVCSPIVPPVCLPHLLTHSVVPCLVRH